MQNARDTEVPRSLPNYRVLLRKQQLVQTGERLGGLVRRVVPRRGGRASGPGAIRMYGSETFGASPTAVGQASRELSAGVSPGGRFLWPGIGRLQGPNDDIVARGVERHEPMFRESKPSPGTEHRY